MDHRIPILQLEQHCSTEAMIGLFPISAQIFFLILLELVVVSQSTVHLCVPFDVLLPIDRSNNSPLVQHSLLSRSELTFRISNCDF